MSKTKAKQQIKTNVKKITLIVFLLEEKIDFSSRILIVSDLVFKSLINLEFTFLCSISSVKSFSRIRLFANPWTAVHQASLSITNSRSLLKLMSMESVMPFNHLILCHPLLPPSVFPGIRVFSNESVFHIRWPKYWSFSFSISPSNEHSGLISFRMD